ncbi:large conductance mechanosensitive channel protein MscL [Mycetocola sp. JXN-3]|uniref:large conductance mechanosensitive channel protein MscL n=1 Tax=Mycetocola sp. JXN-3 TaxID=2116510 RepID=UPI00165D0335|nr:large conductance mechanosensitive channel protein MscL [Mycetocola sp. JXN-3]
MIKGFKEFILRGNVIDLAVAVVIGAAFTSVVNSIVENIFNPIIGALFKADSLNSTWILTIPTLDGSKPAEVKFGAVVGAIISFVIVAIVVYFVFVLPINHFKKRADALLAKNKDTAAEETPEVSADVALLAEIRDLLAANADNAALGSRGPGKHSGE